MILEWPGRCSECRQTIDDWSDAGLYAGRWIHKDCFNRRFASSRDAGGELAGLSSPLDRRTQLELPMIVFMLMFHFGLGGAVAGWVMLTQGQNVPDGSGFVLGLSLVAGLIGAVGAALNIVSRRRIETIRLELDAGGGWKATRLSAGPAALTPE